MIGGRSSISVTFHGVRGSTPCHGDDIVRYGGNTSCVSVDLPGQPPVVFDLGTGLRYFGLGQPQDGTFRGVALLTHLHWDHIQGLPFFTPMLREGSQLDVYGPLQDDGRSFGEAVRAAIRPPVFPISIDDFPGTFRFYEVGDDDLQLDGLGFDDVVIRSRVVPHVGTTVGYRIEWGGRSVVYISDHQQPFDGSWHAPDGVLELAAGADLLIHDAQYTAEEFSRKYNWGHCTPEYAVWLAGEAGVGSLALFHHDPARHDDALDALAACAADAGRRSEVEVFVAREGLTVDVG